jgi:hypothetical protein
MCQVSIFWHCWFTRRRFLNIKIINHFRPPLEPSLDPRNTEHHFGRRSLKEHFGKVWLKLTKCFQEADDSSLYLPPPPFLLVGQYGDI